MLLAFVLQVAGIKPEYEARLIKDLRLVVSSKAVAYVTSYLKNAPNDQDYQLTFLDSKATVVSKLTADSHLSEVQISPDGTMVAALVKTNDVTDILVVNKDGLLAKTHLLVSSEIFWIRDSLMIDSLMINGYVNKVYVYQHSLTKFGQDPELGGWVCKKVSDVDLHIKCAESDSFWGTAEKKGSKEFVMTQLDDKGETKKTVDIGKRHREPKLRAANTPFMLVSSLHFLGDGEGGYESLFVMNLETTEEVLIAPEVNIISSYLWLSGPGFFGCVPNRHLQGRMVFFSPTTGKSFMLGPDVFSPSCVALDADVALLVGSGKTYKLVPGKYRFEKIEIPGVANPDHIYACR